MQYLSAQEILVLHALVVDDTGGSHGVRDIALLQSIAHKPSASLGGSDLYGTVWMKAAVLLESIANYHVFIDGNKRTSLIATARFLALNGYELTATNKAVEKTVLAVATKIVTIEKLAEWLEKNSKES